MKIINLGTQTHNNDTECKSIGSHVSSNNKNSNNLPQDVSIGHWGKGWRQR